VKKISLLTVLVFLFLKGYSQDNQQPKDIILEAESDLLYEEYSEALPLYLKLYKSDTANYNICYKIGVCYLNIPYEKEKSIQYLEKAVKQIDPSVKPDEVRSMKAPLDAEFYLGNAYRINNMLDKAMTVYLNFKSKLDPSVFDETLVNEQIETINRAKKLESQPVYFSAKNLGENINSKFMEFNAVVSADENTLIYNVKLQFYDALFFTKKVNGNWGPPINIIPDLEVDGDVYGTCLSYNGNELYIYRSDKYDGNIYVSRYINDRWTPIVKLNENINTKYWESHASISCDGKTLYFTSNRKGGFGGLDIYKATRSDTNLNDWGNVQILGPEINSKYNEETPFISQDGKILYFSSYDHYNMGGYDILYSSLLEDGKWSTPLNIGYPMNSTDDDIFFVPVQNGNFAYVCRYYPSENYGKTDVYRIELFSDQHPRKFLLKGLVNIPAEFRYDNDYHLIAKVVNKFSHDTIDLFQIDPLKKRFNTNLLAGSYQLIVEGKGLQKSYDEFTIEKNQSNDEVVVNPVLRSNVKEKPVEEIKPVENIPSVIPFARAFYKVYDDNAIALGIKLEKGTKVIVDIYSDTTKVKTENFIINRKSYNFKYIPFPGKNVLRFTATNVNNQISKGEIVIYYEKLADSLSAKEMEAKLAARQEELNYKKSMLASFAQGALKSQLEKLDIAKENISTVEELMTFLKSQGQLDTEGQNQLDSLLKVFDITQPIAAKLLVDALQNVAVGKSKPVVDSLAKSKSTDNIDDVISYLIKNSDSNEELKLNLLSSTIRLADEGNVYYYLLALRKATSGDLKELLDTLNLGNKRINTPEELLAFLLSRASIGEFSADDVFKAYLTIPAFTSTPSVLLNSMIEMSDGKISEFLKTININEKQIKTTAELGMLLFEKANAEDISKQDLVNLLFKVNTAYFNNQLENDLMLFSSGRVKEILSLTDTKKENINSPGELVNYILSKYDHKEIVDELIKVFSQIASKNLIKSENFKPLKKEGLNLSIFTLSLIGAFVVLLIVILLFLFRKRIN
jgi:hypothetical protein